MFAKLYHAKEKKFLELGLYPVGTFPKIAKSVDVIVDCTPEGNKLKEKFSTQIKLGLLHGKLKTKEKEILMIKPEKQK